MSTSDPSERLALARRLLAEGTAGRSTTSDAPGARAQDGEVGEGRSTRGSAGRRPGRLGRSETSPLSSESLQAADGPGEVAVVDASSADSGASAAESTAVPQRGRRASGEQVRRGRRRFGSGASRRRMSDGPDAPADPELDQAADPYSAARSILLDKLTGQPRTRAELADVLAERDIPDDVADEVLDRFTDVGLIDDAAFATAWVETRHRGRGLGKRALAQELRRRGVDDELARDALAELDPAQEEETARALVRKKLPSMRSLDRQVAMRRLLGLLARKGYPGPLAMTVVKQELAASDEELPLLNDSGQEPD